MAPFYFCKKLLLTLVLPWISAIVSMQFCAHGEAEKSFAIFIYIPLWIFFLFGGVYAKRKIILAAFAAAAILLPPLIMINMLTFVSALFITPVILLVLSFLLQDRIWAVNLLLLCIYSVLNLVLFVCLLNFGKG